jgi:hypothetical protein
VRKSIEDAGMLQLTNEFREEFSQAYSDIGKKAALLYDNLYFYEYVAYTVKEDNGDKTRIHIRVGDIVDVAEEQEGVAYAQVKAIVLHKYNDGTLYPFFVFDWFSSTSSRHNILCAQSTTFDRMIIDGDVCILSLLLITNRVLIFFMFAHVHVQSNNMIQQKGYI